VPGHFGFKGDCIGQYAIQFAGRGVDNLLPTMGNDGGLEV
jgi:hypothetical protein